MCNLVGFNGELSPNPDKLKMLMVLGRERGIHSCGLAMNNEVQYGVGHKYKDSLDWIPTLKFPSKFINKTVIGHNRQATVGAHTAENAHPFVYCNDDNVPEFVFAHNGVIRDCTELAKEYGLDYKDYAVDSQLLGDIIYKYGFDVLGKYKGNAALLFYWINEPNKLYCWKGATKDRVFVNKEWVTDFEDERPLHFVYHNKGIYVASLADHLRCITNHNKEIYTFNHNTVYTITDGVLEEILKVDRDHIEKQVVVNNYNNYNNTWSYGYGNGNYYKNKNNDKERKDVIGPNPHNLAKSKVYFYDGRYYQNGKLLDGEVFISKEDKVVNSSKGEAFYFKEGIWLKDKTKHSINRNVALQYIFEADLHEDAIYWPPNSLTGRFGKNINDQIKNDAPYIAGRFCYHGYVVNTAKIIQNFKVIRTQNVLNFNEYFGENCVSEYECEELYKSMFIKSNGIKWDEIRNALQEATSIVQTHSVNNSLLPANQQQYTIDSLILDAYNEDAENELIEEASTDMQNYIEETASGASDIVKNYENCKFTNQKDIDNIKKVKRINNLFENDLFYLLQ